MNILGQFIENKEKMPLLNYMQHAMTLPAFSDFSQVSRKKRLMTVIKRQPEVIGIVRNVATDIAGKSHFEPVNVRSSGARTIMDAEKFANDIGWLKLKRNTIIDALITGEGFNWLGTLSPAQKKVLKEEFKKFKVSTKGLNIVDEDLTLPKKLRTIASSTMSTRYNDSEVVGYTQKVGPMSIDFDTKEIIKISFEELDGKVEGFTPLLALPLHIELLWLLWQNQFYLQAKGNHPDMLLTVEGIDMNHPSYKKVRQELESYNRPGNSTHGALFLAGGKYNATVLDRVDSLQFKEVGQFVTSIIASQWQYPQSRIGVKTAEAAQSKDSGGISEKGYWTSVEYMQDILAWIYNKQLWEPYFGVKEVYDKTYLHDEVVEGTAEQLRLGNLNSALNVLARSGKTIKQQAMLNIINNRDQELTENDLEDVSLTLPQMPGSPSAPKQVGQSAEQRSAKASEELVRERTTGKPTGM